MAPRKIGVWLQKPWLEHVKGKLHIVRQAGEYEAADGTRYFIPVGFQTDGGSVPRPFWAIYPPFGEDDEPAFILHDRVYQYAEMYAGSDRGHLSRGQADGLLREASEALGYRRSGAATIWLAVRLGGKWTWDRYRKVAAANVAARDSEPVA